MIDRLRHLPRRQLVLGAVLFVAYVATIPLANYSIENWGTQLEPGGPHLIQLPLTNLWAPSGVLFIGLALVARDFVQRVLGKRVALAAIAVGIVASATFASPGLVVASALAFGISELADFAVYTPLAEKRLYLAVVASGVVGAFVDSMVFLQVAFGSVTFWQGQVVGKISMSLLALPFVYLMRRAVPTSADAMLVPAPQQA